MRWKDRSVAYQNHLKHLATLDEFELLGVPRDVSSKDLKAAYRMKVKTYHPDQAHPFLRKYNEEVLKLINGAFSKIRRDLGHE